MACNGPILKRGNNMLKQLKEIEKNLSHLRADRKEVIADTIIKLEMNIKMSKTLQEIADIQIDIYELRATLALYRQNSELKELFIDFDKKRHEIITKWILGLPIEIVQYAFDIHYRINQIE